MRTDMALKVFAALMLYALTVSSVKSLQNKYCQLTCDYVTQIFNHTVCDREAEKCGPHPQCGPDFRAIKLTDTERKYIVDLHNYLRNLVAIGNETRGDQPPAANMNLMTYNKELEFIAQCWANTCNGNPLNHDICRRTKDFEHVGQNLGFINSSISHINVHNSIKQLTMLWYDEVAIFDKEWVNDTQDRGPDFKVGHYTQMMWADTSEIGCAVSFYTTNSFNATWNHLILVCNYGPGGNYLGLPIYEVGKPCSKCPKGFEPNKTYKGLCNSIKKVTSNDKKNEIFEF